MGLFSFRISSKFSRLVISERMLYSLRGGSSGDLARDVVGCCDDVTGSLDDVTGVSGGDVTAGEAGESKRDGMLITGRMSGLKVGLAGSLL